MTLPAALRPLAEEPGRCVLGADFDGTLSSIVDDPADARALPEARDAIAALVPHFARVAIVSGRPVEFLADRIGLEGVVLVGQYGLEWSDGSRVHVDERAEPFLDAVDAAAREADRRFPGLLVERKGGLAVTIHWRRAPELEPPAGAVHDLARAHGLVVHPGRRSAEIRPPVPVDKGTAFRARIVDAVDARGAAFAGDDRGDLAVFDALDALERSGTATARIGVESTEAPPDLLRRADVVVDGPAGTARLLQQLAAAISAPG